MDQDTIQKILQGQSALTLQLVEQVRDSQSNSAEIQELQQQFSARNPVGRVRALREWVETHVNDPAALAALAAASRASSNRDRSPSPGRAEVCRDNMAPKKVGTHGLLVLDFDSTLTVKETIGPDDCKEAIDKAFGGSLRVALLQHLLSKCRSHCIEVAIISNTPKAFIQQAMGRRPGCELLPLVNQKFVFGSEDLQGNVPKSAIISRLLSHLQLPPTKLMFVDDEGCNLADVQSACAGAAVLPSPQDGLGRSQCEALCQWCTAMLGGDAMPQWTKHSPDQIWAPLHSNSPSSPTGTNPHWADTLFQVRNDVVRNEKEMGLRA